MKIVLITLIVSLLCPLISKAISVDSVNGDYLLYRTLKALVFLIPAFVFTILSLRLLKGKQNYSCFLVCLLTFCMCVTAIFNLLMINYEMFQLLRYIKSGDGASWKGIYHAVEMLVAINLGGYGLVYLANMDILLSGKRSASVFDSDYHWTGKLK